MTDGIRKEHDPTAIELIQAERRHQIDRGYGPDHDNTHTDGSIAAAAAIIASHDICDLQMTCSKGTPMWPMRLFVDVLQKHPTNKIHRLVISAALLVAEIERLMRLEAKPRYVDTAIDWPAGGHDVIEINGVLYRKAKP